MLEIIRKKNYELFTFPPFIEYIKNLEQENFVLLSDKEEYDWRELIFQNEKEFLKILIFTNEDEEWFSIYKYHQKHYSYMKTEFMLYTEHGIEIFKPACNQVILYAAYKVEGNYAKLVTSGWRHKRIIAKEDLGRIIVPGMNLQELTMRAENIKLNFYERLDEDNGEVRELKLSYDE